MVLSSAMVCDRDRKIADDRRRSQNLLRSAICDPRSYGNQPLERNMLTSYMDVNFNKYSNVSFSYAQYLYPVKTIYRC